MLSSLKNGDIVDYGGCLHEYVGIGSGRKGKFKGVDGKVRQFVLSEVMFSASSDGEQDSTAEEPVNRIVHGNDAIIEKLLGYDYEAYCRGKAIELILKGRVDDADEWLGKIGGEIC